MKLKGAVAAIAIILVAIALTLVALRGRLRTPSHGAASPVEGQGTPVAGAALARLQAIPFYRRILELHAVRAGSVDRDGTLHADVDLRAVASSKLAASSPSGESDWLPAIAKGTIAAEFSGGSTPAVQLRESWVLDGPAALLDLLDRNPAGKTATLALDAIPGTPSAVVRVRLMPSRLTDPELGGEALSTWRDRVSLAEKLLGHPLRAEIAEDVAGPAVFALYETSDPLTAEAFVAVELRRSDRIAELFDMALGLGALAERATVRRYRGVATGSFTSESGGPDFALAVDGPLLFMATSRARLESAIDAKRTGPHRGGVEVAAGDAAASWSAVSASAFVAHGWARLARLPYEPKSPVPTMTAALWPVGTSSWRLEGHGPAPAITADPIVPFLRSAFAGRQGDGE